MISSTLVGARKCHVANPNWSYEVLRPQKAANIRYSTRRKICGVSVILAVEGSYLIRGTDWGGNNV
jgi:hypothetical protein